MAAIIRMPARQEGAVLLVGLMMLLLVTLVAIGGYNTIRTNQQITMNYEVKAQAASAASSVLEEAISQTLFASSPTNFIVNPCAGPNTRCFDINGDGINDITATVAAPVCIGVKPIMNSELDLLDPKQLECAVQTGEIIDAGAESLCADTVWELRAVAVDNVTGAQAVVRQGVGLKTLLNNAAIACPS